MTDDCGVELHYHVVARSMVARERGCTTGYAVDWPEVRSGIDEAASDAECCCRISG